MNLNALQTPPRIGSIFEALSGVEFEQPYAVTLTFPASLQSDATLTHAYASGDVARFIDALEAESITPIRRRSGWKLRMVVFSDTPTPELLRFHLLINNPAEFTDCQIRFAVVRAQRSLKLPGVSASQPDWCLDWHGFSISLIDLAAENLAYEFGLSQLYGIE